MMRTHRKGNKDVSLLYDDKYEKQCKMKLKIIQRSGVVDSISNLLRNYNCDSKRLLNLLLKPH